MYRQCIILWIFSREKKKILVIEKGDIIRLSDIVSVNVIKHDLIFKGVNGERKIRANLSTYEERLKSSSVSLRYHRARWSIRII